MKIAVIGLGAIGSQVLWQLSSRSGVEVHGFDSRYPGHEFAGAGGDTRLFRNLELSNLGYLPIIDRASKLWEQLEKETNQKLLNRSGVLLLGSEDSPQIQTALESAKQGRYQHSILTRAEMNHRFPHINTFEQDIGIWDEQGGVLAPETAVATAAKRAVDNGAVVNTFSRVTALEPTDTGIRVHTGNSVKTFDRVVVACGGWTTQLLPELSQDIVTRRLTSAWFAGKTKEVVTSLPPLMRTAPSYCYAIPSPGAHVMKLGLGFNDHFATGNPDVAPRLLGDSEVEQQLQRFQWVLDDVFPDLHPHPTRMATYIESYSTSMHEYVRTLPSNPNITVLTGFSGHGFKIAPAMGELGAQLATRGDTDIDISFLAEAERVFEITNPTTGETTFNHVMSSKR